MAKLIINSEVVAEHPSVAHLIGVLEARQLRESALSETDFCSPDKVQGEVENIVISNVLAAGTLQNTRYEPVHGKVLLGVTFIDCTLALRHCQLMQVKFEATKPYSAALSVQQSTLSRFTTNTKDMNVRCEGSTIDMCSIQANNISLIRCTLTKQDQAAKCAVDAHHVLLSNCHVGQDVWIKGRHVDIEGGSIAGVISDSLVELVGDVPPVIVAGNGPCYAGLVNCSYKHGGNAYKIRGYAMLGPYGKKNLFMARFDVAGHEPLFYCRYKISTLSKYQSLHVHTEEEQQARNTLVAMADALRPGV